MRRVEGGGVGLLNVGEFQLSSGRTSRLKIDCDALTDGDVECLALLVRHLVGPFSGVEGVPRGGLRLAEALRMYEIDGPLLIVDDVLTTGKSMEQARGKHWMHTSCHPDVIARVETSIVGAVIFARGPCPAWVKAVFPWPPELWGK